MSSNPRGLLFPITFNLKLDARGRLDVVEFLDLFFVPQRVYFLSNVPKGAKRGEHGHKTLEQIFFALKGSYSLFVSNGEETDSVNISNNGYGYYIKGGLWRSLENFSDDAICVVFASHPYDPEDYIYEYDEYLEWKGLRVRG